MIHLIKDLHSEYVNNLQKLTVREQQSSLKIGKSVEMICQLENGLSGTKLSTLLEIADELNIEVYQLFLDAPLLTIEDLSTDLVEIMHELQDQNDTYVRAVLNLVKAPRD